MRAAVQVLVDGAMAGVGRMGGTATTAAARGPGNDRVAAARSLARALSSAVPVLVLDGADGPRDDPYRLANHLLGVEADAVVLVAPRRRGPRRLSPGPVVDGRPVALVQADGPTDLAHRLPDPDPTAPWVVAAMARNTFLQATDDWSDRLRAGGRNVVDLRADRARREDLVSGLQAGPRVVLYAGHGRARGWAGYQALRFHHLAPGTRSAAERPSGRGGADPRAVGEGARAVGLVVAFACDTLGRSHNQWPFGVRLVESGLVRAYLAPASTVLTADATALSVLVLDILAGRRPASVAELVTAIDRATAVDAPARRAWRTFRLVGAPDTVIA